MSRPTKDTCGKCGKDLTMSGSQVCRICVPNVLKAPRGSIESLCAACFTQKLATSTDADSGRAMMKTAALTSGVNTITGSKMLGFLTVRRGCCLLMLNGAVDEPR